MRLDPGDTGGDTSGGTGGGTGGGSGSGTGTTAPTSFSPIGIATNGNDVFLTSPGEGIVLKLNRYSTTPQVIPFPDPTCYPLDLAVKTNANSTTSSVWVTENHSGKIASISALDLTITEYFVGGDPTAICKSSDGAMWYTKTSFGKIGKIEATGAFQEFAVGTSVYGICQDTTGLIWYTKQFPARIGSMTSSGVVTELRLPNENSVPTAIRAFADGTVWYSDSYLGVIVRAK